MIVFGRETSWSIGMTRGENPFTLRVNLIRLPRRAFLRWTLNFHLNTFMQPPIGFILLTHRNPDQIIRLVNRLTSMFGPAPIVCHHDFSKCALPLESFPKHVSFVVPHLVTSWARFSVVEGTAKALQQMYAGPTSPDVVVVLSGADYPIKPARQILNDLQADSFDAHIGSELIQAGKFEREWQKSCFERYCTVKLTLPGVTKRLQWGKWRLRFGHPLLTRLLLPYSKDLRCFAGSQWFCVGRRAAEYIRSFRMRDSRLAAHCAKCMFSEETYFQTILANSSELRLNHNSWRYIDWSEQNSHPKTLSCEDLPKLMASDAHFARKFDPEVDSRILDELDSVVDGS